VDVEKRWNVNDWLEKEKDGGKSMRGLSAIRIIEREKLLVDSKASEKRVKVQGN
jgi:hypothetical protein